MIPDVSNERVVFISKGKGIHEFQIRGTDGNIQESIKSKHGVQLEIYRSP